MLIVAERQATGISAVIAFVHCVFVNVLHFYLSKTSEQRQTIFGKKLIFWSHLSMLSMSLAPLLMIFSYYHPENLFDNNICWCQPWYSFSVIFFCTGLFSLKINYLVRLNMVLNPSNHEKYSKLIKMYLILLCFEAILVNIIQYIVIDANCTRDNITNQLQFGCIATFADWSMFILLYLYFYIYKIIIVCIVMFIVYFDCCSLSVFLK